MKNALLTFLTLFFVTVACAQKEKLSPAATAMNSVSGVDIKIDYSQPSVKGRTIWGDLVPYDEVWRTGANEATTIEFSKDVKINGNAVPAGKYALFTIPGKNEWVVIINKEAKQWGAYKYKKDEDVLRINVKPDKTDGQAEKLTFNIAQDGKVMMSWDQLSISFNVTASN
jgi:hypothetical protein